jgi:hypothetical protein
MEDMRDAQATVVAAVADLIFGARIRGAAEQAGVPVRFARSMDELRSLVAGARLVLLDLDAGWLEVGPAVEAAHGAGQGVQVVAFVSHVRTDAMNAARVAGADQVMPRSAFVRELPALLRG